MVKDMARANIPKTGKRLLASAVLSASVLLSAALSVSAAPKDSTFSVQQQEEIETIVRELLAQMKVSCPCGCSCTESESIPEESSPENNTATGEGDTTKNGAVTALQIPEQIHVFVDSTQSVTVKLLDSQENEYTLADKERLHALCDGAVARADVYGQSVTLTGVQDGTTTLTLQLQRENGQGTFETVMADVDGVLTPLEISATVIVENT